MKTTSPGTNEHPIGHMAMILIQGEAIFKCLQSESIKTVFLIIQDRIMKKILNTCLQKMFIC